jgi:hypothetical protein
MLKKNLIIFILVIASTLCLAQMKKREPYKSYFKGDIFYFPNFIFTVSFNYERQIGPYSSLDLSGNLFIRYGEYHNTWTEPVYFTYRQYTTTNRRFLRNFWAGPYVSYIHSHQTNYEGGAYRGEYVNAYGLGLAAGRKIFFGENSRFFMDIGGGITFSNYIYTDQIECTRTYEYFYRSPRIIILIGLSN